MIYARLRVAGDASILHAKGAHGGLSRGGRGLIHVVASPWFWGFCGAFIYAAPRFSACLFGATGPCVKCALDGAFSVVIGPIAAGAFTGEVQSFLHLGAADHVAAVSAMIGLLANPIAPSAIEVLTGGVLKRLRALVNGGQG